MVSVVVRIQLRRHLLSRVTRSLSVRVSISFRLAKTQTRHLRARHPRFSALASTLLRAVGPLLETFLLPATSRQTVTARSETQQPTRIRSTAQQLSTIRLSTLQPDVHDSRRRH